MAAYVVIPEEDVDRVDKPVVDCAVDMLVDCAVEEAVVEGVVAFVGVVTGKQHSGVQ